MYARDLSKTDAMRSSRRVHVALAKHSAGAHAADESVSQLLMEAAEMERLQGGLAASDRAVVPAACNSCCAATANRCAAPLLDRLQQGRHGQHVGTA